jgi:hypothetical protein
MVLVFQQYSVIGYQSHNSYIAQLLLPSYTKVYICTVLKHLQFMFLKDRDPYNASYAVGKKMNREKKIRTTL